MVVKLKLGVVAAGVWETGSWPLPVPVPPSLLQGSH